MSFFVENVPCCHTNTVVNSISAYEDGKGKLLRRENCKENHIQLQKGKGKRKCKSMIPEEVYEAVRSTRVKLPFKVIPMKIFSILKLLMLLLLI